MKLGFVLGVGSAGIGLTLCMVEYCWSRLAGSMGCTGTCGGVRPGRLPGPWAGGARARDTLLESCGGLPGMLGGY